MSLKRKSTDTIPSPDAKKSKSAAFQPASSLSAPETDEDGNPFWSLSKARRVTISEYRGKQMIGVREYYEKDGKWLPGKKGITMTVEQYSALLGLVPAIETCLRGRGEEVARVEYGAAKMDRESSSDEEEDDRKNYEETDEE